MSEMRDEQRSKRDPRLLPPPSATLSVLAFYGRAAGWAGLALLVVTLLWAAVVKGFTPIPVKVIGILALACVAFWLYSNVHQLVVAIRTRGVQSALNSALFTVLILGILVLVNYMGGRYTEYIRKDVTKNKQFSLSDQTRNVLRDLNQKVTITAFLSDEAYNADELRRLLREYDIRSNKLDVTFYDFKTALDKVQEYGARFDGTMYVEAGEEGAKRKEEIQGGSEEQITSAILAVTTGKKTRICFLTGHGEATPDAAGGDGKRTMSMLKSILDNQQYQVDTLNLITQKQPAIPGDCKLLIIAGAKFAPTPAEMGAITRYVDQAGNLFLMLEPDGPNFAELLKAHGVTPVPGKLSDPMSSAEGRPEILATMPEAHDVTRGLQFVILPTTVGFEVAQNTPPPAMPGAPPPPNDNKAVPVLKTTDQATVAGQAGRRGPFSVAVAIDESTKAPEPMPGMPPDQQPQESGERKARIMVVGDSDFATDEFIPSIGGFGRQNVAFAAMAANWLLKNEKLVAIPPKEPVEKPFSVTDSQKRLTWVITVGIVPLLIIMAGTFVWWRRRV